MKAPPERHQDGWWLALSVYTALLIRGYLPFENVFGGERVGFQGNDAWYHLRLIDVLAQNPLRPMAFDPYAFFPGGQTVGVAPLLDLLVAWVAWFVGLGSPSERVVDVVAAVLPAVLGALTVLPVYAIGRRLGGRRVGLIAAGLLAVQPGQFMLRSLLGFVDHHVAETLFSTLTVWLLLRALDRASWDIWQASRACALAGVALGAYLLSWAGGSLFVAILGVWAVAQHVMDHLRGRDATQRIHVLVSMAVVAAIVLVPFMRFLPRVEIHFAALAVLAFLPILLEIVSQWIEGRGWPRWLFPALSAAGAVVGAGGVHAVWPSLTERILAHLGRFLPGGLRHTVGEALPLLETSDLPLDAIWQQYRLAMLLGLLGLAVLLPRIWRRSAPGDLLLLVWSLAMFAITLGQNRFGYYLDVNLCLLTALLCRRLLGPFGVRLSGISWQQRLLRGVAAVAVAAAAFLPAVNPGIALARAQRAPPPTWLEALTWLRDNTPPPLGDDATYYRSFGPQDGSFEYPKQAYGVMSWWDYGYWITRIAHRIPNANPTQRGATDAARFFLATDEASAGEILRAAGSRYVVVNSELGFQPDPHTGVAFSLFHNLLAWAGEDPSKFFEVVWEVDEQGALTPTTIFRPAFYRSMANRLNLYGAAGATPLDSTWVVALEERFVDDGTRIPVVVESRQFAMYEDALVFLESRPAGGWQLVGLNPFESCVPLAPLESLRQVHQVPTPEIQPAGERPVIRILEYVG